jgi:hypothetical protein
VLRVFDLKAQTQAILGRDPYLRIFGQAAKNRQTATETCRVVEGQLVGKALDAGVGKAQRAANSCQHEDKFMKARGNKNSQWWTCVMCQSRWERLSLPNAETSGEPQDDEMLTFGKHAGLTMAQMYQTKKDYCRWALATAETEPAASDGLLRLARYVAHQEAQEAMMGSENHPKTNDNPKTNDEDDEDCVILDSDL